MYIINIKLSKFKSIILFKEKKYILKELCLALNFIILTYLLYKITAKLYVNYTFLFPHFFQLVFMCKTLYTCIYINYISVIIEKRKNATGSTLELMNKSGFTMTPNIPIC